MSKRTELINILIFWHGLALQRTWILLAAWFGCLWSWPSVPGGLFPVWRSSELEAGSLANGTVNEIQSYWLKHKQLLTVFWLLFSFLILPYLLHFFFCSSCLSCPSTVFSLFYYDSAQVRYCKLYALVPLQCPIVPPSPSALPVLTSFSPPHLTSMCGKKFPLPCSPLGSPTKLARLEGT